jgi:hypothetical protein
MLTVTMNQVTQVNDIGLGNHMFQYAICRLIAEKRGLNFYTPYDQSLRSCFPNLKIGIADGPIQYQFTEDYVQTYNPNIFTLPDFTHIHGYFQTEKYFEGSEEQVKSYFELEVTEDVKYYLDKYPPDNFCYLHIRASGNKNGEAKYLLPNEYYNRGMEKIREINSDLSFVIVTDDYEFSKQNFPDIDVISSSVSTDFRLIYYSKYSIISNSTFAWWAAWLGEKVITIAPENWLNFKFPEQGYFPIDVKSKKFTYIG